MEVKTTRESRKKQKTSKLTFGKQMRDAPEHILQRMPKVLKALDVEAEQIQDVTRFIGPPKFGSAAPSYRPQELSSLEAPPLPFRPYPTPSPSSATEKGKHACPGKILNSMYDHPTYNELLRRYLIHELTELKSMLEHYDTHGPTALGGKNFCHFTKERMKEYIQLYQKLLAQFFQR